jgi:hypothetical protein
MDEIVGKGLVAGGVSIQPLPNRRIKKKRIYYHPGTGEPTCPLPADQYHERIFLSRGFTLEPPSVEGVPAKRKYKHTRKFLEKQAQRKLKKGAK